MIPNALKEKYILKMSGVFIQWKSVLLYEQRVEITAIRTEIIAIREGV